MAIATNRNSTYGALTGTNKYSPLLNISFDASTDEYSKLLLNRWRLLTSAGLLPQALNLSVLDWTMTTAGEAGRQPPLVVISSNRSAWIRAGIAAADAQPADKKPYKNASDLRALTAEKGQTVSPPIYCPSRNGGVGRDRNIYVVVHQLEYDTYQKNLADKGINVVGWSFRLPRGGAPRITGFGASRYAAIEFCKELRRLATVGGRAPWDYVWLFDDNVVALSGFPGYAAVEKALREANTSTEPDEKKETVCIGFRGDSKIPGFETTRTWAQGIWNTPAGRQASEMPPSADKGLLQQAVLWNLDYLTKKKLNFGPAFIMSAEDLSITRYFENQNIAYLYCNSIAVHKELTTYDNSTGSQWLRRAREEFTGWVTEMESSESDPPTTLPPPVRVQSLVPGDTGVQTLASFIDERVLTSCAIPREDQNVAIRNTAKSNAVEQITCGAIENKVMNDDALNNTFKINGTAEGAAQTIVTIDKPVRI